MYKAEPEIYHTFYSKQMASASGEDGFEQEELLNVSEAGFNPSLTVLVVVVGTLIAFLVGNYFLWSYAQKVLPAKRKKPISKKKMQKERMKRGVSMAGE